MKTVLIIEDNDEIRENTSELLEIAGYTVLTAKDGNDGFSKTLIYNPDVILCDMMMPKSNGLDFLKKIKKEDSTKSIPLIFFSAGSAPLQVQRGLELGADEYLAKPFTEEQLLTSIGKYVH